MIGSPETCSSPFSIIYFHLKVALVVYLFLIHHHSQAHLFVYISSWCMMKKTLLLSLLRNDDLFDFMIYLYWIKTMALKRTYSFLEMLLNLKRLNYLCLPLIQPYLYKSRTAQSPFLLWHNIFKLIKFWIVLGSSKTG